MPIKVKSDHAGRLEQDWK